MFNQKIISKVSNEGSIENGISNALWSPNQEHLIIATNNKSLILLDVHFDFIKEIPLDDDDSLIKDVDMSIDNVSLVWREDSKVFFYKYNYCLIFFLLVYFDEFSYIQRKENPYKGSKFKISDKCSESRC